MGKLSLPYGRSRQELTAGACEVLDSHIQDLPKCADETAVVRAAMEAPIGSPRLRELAAGKKTAVLIISDHTRPVPSRHIVPLMLQELREGNPDIRVTLLVATGCHRGTLREELEHKLGGDILERERIVVHDCDASPMTDMGVLPSGARLIINSLVAESDLVVAEGFIEPHFCAGFSGGRKSILPGVCSRTTVLGNHCAAFIDSPRATMGTLEGNPINRDMEAAARMGRLAYIVNVVIDAEKRVVAAFAGDALKAHHTGCAFLRRYCVVRPERPGDIVVTSNGGAPLDQNVYQAVKGLTTAASAAAPGAALIICAVCADGIGGEAFYQALRGCDSASSLLKDIRAVPMERTVPDQWQYQILARIIEDHPVIFATRPELRTAIGEMKMTYAPSLEEALCLARGLKGENARLTVIPDGVSVIVEPA